jgi:hypothetical protein
MPIEAELTAALMDNNARIAMDNAQSYKLTAQRPTRRTQAQSYYLFTGRHIFDRRN